MEVFEERISRFRNVPPLFGSFQHRQNFLPIVDTSSNVFFLIIERVKANALVKEREQKHVISTDSSHNAIHTYLVLLKIFKSASLTLEINKPLEVYLKSYVK